MGFPQSKKLFRFTGFTVSLLITLFLMGLCLSRPLILELFELKAFDQRLRWRGELPTTGEVVVVAIDEKSLQEMGQWPWSRIVMGELIEALSRLGAKVIGLDIAWPEPERRSGVLDALYEEEQIYSSPALLKELKLELSRLARENPGMNEFLKQVVKTVHPDQVLAKAIEESGRVVVGDFLFMKAHESEEASLEKLEMTKGWLGKMHYPIVRSHGSLPMDFPVPKPKGVKGNIPSVIQAAKAIGFFNMVPDPDGVVRAAPMAMALGESMVAPLAIQTLRFSGRDPSWLILDLEPFGVAGIQWEGGWIPTSEEGFLIINYRGKARTFPYVSAVDVLKERIERDQIREKIVLVGAVATGIYDLRVTPLDPIFPGVEVHATIVDNILRGDYIQRPGWVSIVDLLVLLSLGILLGMLFPRLRPMTGALLMLGVFWGQLYLNAQVLINQGYWLNAIYPSLLVPLSYLGVTVHKYVLEEKEKRRLKGAFQVYVAPAVVQQITKDPKALKLGGEQKVLTVLFSDIRGFTTISEGLRPEELVLLLNEYLTEMTQVIFRHEGTLDKYIGDAIMAIYGAPLPQADHPLRACLSAVEMMEALKLLRERWRPRGLPELDIGIGINTGEMVVGNMGSERRFDYTVMGDNVNLASRLEGLNKQYGTHILVSEFTASFLKDKIPCREVDLVRVKGKSKPVRIYEILSPSEGVSSDSSWLELFARGLGLYREMRWEEAAGCFQEVLKLLPQDGPSKLYLQRCKTLSEEPPSGDWEGVYSWETK
jgi:adenylate cyclase